MERENETVTWLRQRAASEPNNDEAAKLWGAADLIESLRADLSEQKAGHRDCIKRNIALAAENATLRAERDEARKALKPFANVVVMKAEAAAAHFGADNIAQVPDSCAYGPTLITWGDLRRAAAAIRNMGGEG